jgi:hypothetical protein
MMERDLRRGIILEASFTFFCTFPSDTTLKVSPMSDEDKRIIARRQIRMLKAIGRMYLAAYVSGNQKPFLESLHHAWFSFFTPTDSMQQYVYMPESLDPNSEEYVDVKVSSNLLCMKLSAHSTHLQARV